MIQVFSQLLSAALGSVGFGLIFNLNRRYLPAAGVGGLLAWLAYLLAANTLHSVFLANLLAGFCAALYAEILARCCNAPSTPFFITAAIPLIPGSTLYYCIVPFSELPVSFSASPWQLWHPLSSAPPVPPARSQLHTFAPLSF